RVFVTTLTDGQHAADAFAGLTKASGFIRSELGRRLHLRYTPELIFQKDVSGPRGDRVLTLLDSLEARRREDRPPSARDSVTDTDDVTH
ncbi:MAG: 30S ribosome-binding factor RbfA, partial [Nitrospirae bacterium]|nr:30S ribosome-binding factor RbfA [Nitrospirota bacterium]